MGSPVPTEEPMGEDPFGGAEEGGDPFGGGDEGGAEKPFDDTPFDAGVEADEEASPEKYIQQLAGKLGQSLRSHSSESGEPDFDLEKFAVNSVLSATHTAEMTPDDQADIISKVKSSGSDGEEPSEGGLGAPSEEEFDAPEEGGEGGPDLEDIEMEEGFNPTNSKTVFADSTLGVKKGGGEENKHLNLESTKKSSIFVDNIKTMVRQQLTESPTILPATKPIVKPTQPRPTRKGKPFRITPTKAPNPQPKAMNEDGNEGKDIRFVELVSKEVGEKFLADFTVGELAFTDKEFKLTGISSKPDAEPCGDEPWVYEYKTEPMGDERKVYGMHVTFKCDIMRGSSNNFMQLGTQDNEPNNPEIWEE
jgi:hypothetical protein